MEKIIKKDGYVYLEKWHDIEGRHKTIYNLGKDPDSEIWKEKIEEKPKTRKRKKSNN